MRALRRQHVEELSQSDRESDATRMWRRRCMSLGGKLNYVAMGSRPDIAGALSMVMRHVAGANREVYQALLKVARYLVATKEYAVHLGARPPEAFVKNIIEHCKHIDHNPWTRTSLAVFCDASQGGPRAMRSAIIMFEGAPIAWRIGRLQSTTLSSAEAEWFAQTAGATVLQAMAPTMDFMGIHPQRPVLSFCDNKAAVLIAEADLSTKRMKHVLTRMAYLQERIHEGLLALVHIQAEGMIADIGTKRLPATTFHRLREHLVRPA